MSVEMKPKIPSMEQATAKAEAFIKAKASSRGKVIAISSFGCNLSMVGATDIYVVEGNIEVETAPEERTPATKDFLGRVKTPERFIPQQFLSAIWKVQLKLEDLTTLGFDLKF